MKKIWKFYLPPVLWAGAIFWNSSRTHLSFPKLGFQSIDKLAHFGVYFILGYLILRAFSAGARKEINWKKSLLLITLGAVYGASDEWHQMFVPGRQADAADWMADFIGIIFGHAAFRWVSLRAKNRRVRSDLTTAAEMAEKSTQ
jgi:VanZ family protein